VVAHRHFGVVEVVLRESKKKWMEWRLREGRGRDEGGMRKADEGGMREWDEGVGRGRNEGGTREKGRAR
jgi:hypothetical protein